jgi:hypothetical protein
MAIDPTRLPELIDRLANALQTALLLAAWLEPDLKQSAHDASDFLKAVSKASAALEESASVQIRKG